MTITRQFNVAGADLLEEIYSHLSAVRPDLMADRIDAEHIAAARDLALVAWRAQRATSPAAARGDAMEAQHV
jgi:hypothetical protein